MTTQAALPGNNTLPLAIEHRLARIEKQLGRIADNYDLLRGAISALQQDLVKAIPVMQKVDHLQAIKAEEKRFQEELRRSVIRTSYNFGLPGMLEKRRKKGENVPYHPGQILHQRLGKPSYDEKSMTMTRQLAATMGVRHSDLRKFMNGHIRMSTKLASSLAQHVGETSEYWVGLQKIHDEWWARNPELKIAPELRNK